MNLISETLKANLGSEELAVRVKNLFVHLPRHCRLGDMAQNGANSMLSAQSISYQLYIYIDMI